jgi:hypothetical protein
MGGRDQRDCLGGKFMKIVLVNFTSSYHRAVAESLAKKGVAIIVRVGDDGDF